MAKRAVKAKPPVAKAQAAVTDPFETVAEDVPVSAQKAPVKSKAKTRSQKPKASESKAVAAKPVTRKTCSIAEAPKGKAAPTQTAERTTRSAKAKTADTVKPATRAAKRKARKNTLEERTVDVTAEIAAGEPKVELSAVFKALAEPTLPELQRENRARLMMQSPTELYFYWSLKENPYHVLRTAFGSDIGTYTLVLKLTELRTGVEEVHAVESEGNWWFVVEPDGQYRAEIGFYAPNRPYFRILHSNTVETPRRAPSRQPATDAEWRVTAHKFAQVLDVAGFAQDAFDVAMAGDDPVTSDEIAHTAFKQFIGSTNGRLRSVAAEDVRYTMVALAAGVKLEELRWRVSPSLFAFLQANADKLEAGRARSALTEHFDIDETELVEEHYGPAVHGASLVHFPRTLKPRNIVRQYRPFSSHSLR